ncbi:hypothetical protein [Mycoplasmopsis glycophila]|uniref:Uncharacterized protein n=1 Tax=Mycoplasmopsis glycophila TaxID=171285 RepID=A0A449AU48_9BACT|nr:hypothetical protein [Mycoplasmopsis glycophila]VEU70049.1 Uncharacterised protein [Mycoplasmopsis glycophila]
MKILTKNGKAFMDIIKKYLKPSLITIAVVCLIGILGTTIRKLWVNNWNFGSVNYGGIIGGGIGAFFGLVALLVIIFVVLRYTLFKGPFYMIVEKTIHEFVLEPLNEFFTTKESRYDLYCMQDEKVRVDSSLVEEKSQSTVNKIEKKHEAVEAQHEGDLQALRIGVVKEKEEQKIEQTQEANGTDKQETQLSSVSEKTSFLNGAGNRIENNTDFGQERSVLNTEKLEYKLVAMDIYMLDLQEKLSKTLSERIKSQYSNQTLLKFYEGFLAIEDLYFHTSRDQKLSKKEKKLSKYNLNTQQPKKVKMSGMQIVYSKYLAPLVRNKDGVIDEEAMDVALDMLLKNYTNALINNMGLLSFLLTTKRQRAEIDKVEERINSEDWLLLKEMVKYLLEINMGPSL